MKKMILKVVTLSVITLSMSCKENPTEKINDQNVEIAAKRDANAVDFPSLTFDKLTHDFGTIESNEQAVTKFSYTNTGNSMLVVSNIKSSCGCTVPKNWTREVPPGETGEFEVQFRTRGNDNRVSKTITLTTNTEKGSEAVSISAFVKKDPNATKIAPAAVRPKMPNQK